jgi:hypothetical protein
MCGSQPKASRAIAKLNMGKLTVVRAARVQWYLPFPHAGRVRHTVAHLEKGDHPAKTSRS